MANSFINSRLYKPEPQLVSGTMRQSTTSALFRRVRNKAWPETVDHQSLLVPITLTHATITMLRIKCDFISPSTVAIS